MIAKVSPPKRTTPNHAHAASRVLTTARQQFLLHGFRGVTMEHLAAELRMSKNTLYAHHSSKTALLEAVVRDKFERIEADLRRLTEASDVSFSDRLQGLVGSVRGHAEELHPAFLRDLRAEEPDLFARMQRQRRELILRYFGRVLDDGRATGAVRQDVPSELLIEILIGAVEAIAVSPCLQDLDLTLQAAFTQIISVFLHGALVRPESGHR